MKVLIEAFCRIEDHVWPSTSARPSTYFMEAFYRIEDFIETFYGIELNEAFYVIEELIEVIYVIEDLLC